MIGCNNHIKIAVSLRKYDNWSNTLLIMCRLVDIYVLVFLVDPAEETFYGGERIVFQVVELEPQAKESVHWMMVWSQEIYLLRCWR